MSFNTSWVTLSSASSYTPLAVFSSPDGKIKCISALSTTFARVYTSANYGATWVSYTLPGAWYTANYCLAVSNNYIYINIAGSGVNGLYRSTNYGVSFQLMVTVNFGQVSKNIVCSATGQYIYSNDSEDGQMGWRSSDYGVTFPQNQSVWAYNAISPDGSIVMGTQNTTIYYATDYGITYILSAITNFLQPPSLLISNSGMIIWAASNAIYKTTDYGINITTLSTLNVTCVTGDSTLQYLAANVSNSSVYTSTNYGSTWTQNTGTISTASTSPYTLAIDSNKNMLYTNYLSSNGIYYNPYIYTGGTIAPSLKLDYGSGIIDISSNVTAVSAYTFTGSINTNGFIYIPSTVTSIGTGAFSGCVSLAALTIPSSITTFANETAYNCTSLSSITIASATSIGNNAFYNCVSLTTMGSTSGTITIPTSVTTIGYSAFNSCVSITTVTMTLVTSIGSGAFSGCSKLTSITLSPTSTGLASYSAIQSGTTTYRKYWGIPDSTLVSQA